MTGAGAIATEATATAAFARAVDARFAQTVAAALARATRHPPDGTIFALPDAVRGSIALAAERVGRLPEALVDHYLERMPRLLIEQMFCDDDPAARLLWRPIPSGAQPRLDSALLGVERVLGPATTHVLGALPSAETPCPAALHARGLFGSSAPLLGASPAERALMNAELAAGMDPDRVLDLRLSGNLVHELCHGRPQPMPWTILESVALALGVRARPEHFFPDVAGEAVPGVSLFICIGDALARLYGEAALWRVLAGHTADAVFGEGPARAFERAGWQSWLARPVAPFITHALDAFAWVKLADRARLGALTGEDLLGEAERTPWRDLPWYGEAPSAKDRAMLATGVRALFQVNLIAPTFQTHPAELPEQRLLVDLEACAVTALRRPEGVFGEPARWIAPPPWCRVLGERGARLVVVENATRARWRDIASTLWELAAGTAPLAREIVIRCSR